MHCRNESSLVAADVEDGEFADGAGVWKDLPQFREIREAVFADLAIPMCESRLRLGMSLCEIVQPLPSDDMHALQWAEFFLHAYGGRVNSLSAQLGGASAV
jgi:hypothetical protein